jgi:hypothetical protein
VVKDSEFHNSRSLFRRSTFFLDFLQQGVIKDSLHYRFLRFRHRLGAKIDHGTETGQRNIRYPQGIVLDIFFVGRVQHLSIRRAQYI